MAGGAILTSPPSPASATARSIVSSTLDGQGFLVLTYSDGTADRLGPITMVSLSSATDPGTVITVDPTTGDVFETTRGQ